MKNILLLCLTVLLYSSKGIAQTPNWEWKKVWQGGMGTHRAAQSIDGYIIFTGGISDSVVIDGQVYKVENGNIFNARIDPNGNILWFKQYKDISVYYMFNGYTSDRQGNVYYSINTTKPNVSLDNIVLADSGNYLIKVKTDGNIQWAYQTNGAIRDIAIDKDNNVFGIGAHSITNNIAYLSGKLYAFLLNSNDGSLVWEYVNSDIGQSQGIYTSADTLGNIFILGVTDTDINWNGTLLSRHPDPDGKNFILKINQAGNIEWHIPVNMIYSNQGYGRMHTLQADNKGGLYISGIVKNELYFNTQQINPDTDNKKYVYLTHIGSNGALLNYNNLITDYSQFINDFIIGELRIRNDMLYLSYQYQDSVAVGQEVLSKKNAPFSSVNTACVLSAFDTSGNYQWSKQVYNRQPGYSFEFDIFEDNIYVLATSFMQCAFDDGQQYQSSRIPYFAKLSHTSGIPGIEEPTLSKNQLLVYPNPAQNTIRLQWNANVAYDRVVIRDILGREVLLENVNPKQNGLSLSLKHLPKGIYTVELCNKSEKKIAKVVLQ